MHKNKKQKRERGAIIVEATISLTTFIFAMFTLYSLVNICYVQSKMAVAVNVAAKEMSQYAYLYSKIGLDKYMSGSGGKSSEALEEGLGVFFKELGNDTESISEDLSSMLTNVGEVASGDSGAEYIKNGTGMALAKALVQKNLVAYEGDTAAAFLLRNNVVDGLGGLNFVYTSFLSNKDQDEIDIVVTYDVRVIELLGIEYDFTFVQRAQTKAWCDADAKGSEETGVESTIWEDGQLSRGEEIVEKEKGNYRYTSDTNGFHAYDPAKNEFIRIRSINTFDKTYSGEDGTKQIEYALNSTYKTMYDKVDGLGENITVKNSSGNNANFTSNPDTRTYKIVLVVPDDADMSQVEAAVAEFERKKGAKVEIKTGYGNHEAPKTEEPAAPEGNTEET